MKVTIIAILLGMITFSSPSVSLFAQESESGRYGSDSTTCIMNISLYREFFKQWKASNYTNEVIRDVIPPWRWVLINCPKGTQNTYIDGTKIMSYLIESTTDKNLRNKYIDTLVIVYDQRIKYFGKEGFVLGRKGVDLFTYRPEDTEMIYQSLKRSIELEGNASAGPVVVYYMRSAINMAKEGKADSAVIFDAYDEASAIIDHNIKANEGNAEEKANWEIVQNNIEVLLEPFATCTDLVSIFRKKFEASPDDVELLKKITTLLDNKKCHTDPLYFETTERLHDLEPSPESAYLLGKMLLTEEKYSEAIEYLKQAETLSDPSLVQKSYKYIAQAYLALRNFPMARSYALKSIAINPNDGEPYLMIGDMYAESAKDCGDNDLTSRVAFWAAVDKYFKAKQVDPSVAEIADKRIASYSIYFPSTQTIFFYALKEGDTYSVGCWINEDTRVRASK
jgi:tetratricopeptide (TPR) repeat protein